MNNYIDTIRDRETGEERPIRDTSIIANGGEIGKEELQTITIGGKTYNVVEKKYWHQIRIEVNPDNFTYANKGKKVRGVLVAYLDYYSTSNEKINTMEQLYELLKTNELNGIEISASGSFYEPQQIKIASALSDDEQIYMYMQYPANDRYEFLSKSELDQYNIYDVVYENIGYTNKLPMFTYTYEVAISEADISVYSIPYSSPYAELSWQQMLFLQDNYGWASYTGGNTTYKNLSDFYKIEEVDNVKYLYHTDGVYFAIDKYQFKVKKINLTNFTSTEFGANEY